jgi:hypothetical protein
MEARARETSMLEYDQNLPQEIGHKPNRILAGLQGIALALALVILVYALIVFLPIISHYQL